MLFGSIQSTCSHRIRQRGLALFFQRSVQLLPACEPDRITAEVTGTAGYVVDLALVKTPDRWRIRGDCDCLCVQRGGGICKHIWATLLTAHAAGRLVGAPDAISLHLRSGEPRKAAVAPGARRERPARKPASPPAGPGHDDDIAECLVASLIQLGCIPESGDDDSHALPQSPTGRLRKAVTTANPRSGPRRRRKAD